MKDKTNKISIIFEKYINRIEELVDFTLLEEEKNQKEKIILKVLLKLYKDLAKNKIKSPEYIHIYKVAIKVLLKTDIKIKDIDIKKLKNFYNVEDKLNFDLIKKALIYLEPEDRFILLLTHKHKLSAKELSLVLNKTEGFIYSSLNRAKNFILDFYKKDTAGFTKTKDCFFIENHFESYKQNFLKENKTKIISEHINNCNYCTYFFNKTLIIDKLISEFKTENFDNIFEKTYKLINHSFNLKTALKQFLNSWILKTSLSLGLIVFLIYNINLPEFNFIEFEQINIPVKNEPVAELSAQKNPIIDEILEAEELEEEEKLIATASTIDTNEIESSNTLEIFGPFLEDKAKFQEQALEAQIETKESPGKAEETQKFVYKLTTVSNKWQEIDTKLFSNIEKYNASQAGNLALGSESNSGSYYHMYVDIDKLDKFLKDINLITTFTSTKEPETRVVPNNKARMVIWIGRN